MRAQSMSLYEHRGEATPFLDQMGESSSVYVDMHANATMTVPSLTSLLTGKHPLTHGRISRLFPPNRSDENLLRILRNRGYSTAAVTSNIDATFASLGLDAELTEPETFAFRPLAVSWFHDLGVQPTLSGARMYQDLSMIFPFLAYPQRTATGHVEDTVDRAVDIISHTRQPFFLFIHIHEPHESYPPSSVLTLISRFLKQIWTRDQSKMEFYGHYDPALQPVVDGYKAEYGSLVRAVDTELGRLFSFLHRQSWFDNSLVIITADHGESFERGYLNHGEELYENSTHVPLLVRFPGQRAGERVTGLTRSIDIAPTILNALNIPVPAWMDGQALSEGVSPDNRIGIATNYKDPDAGFYPATKLAIWWNRYKMIIPCARGATELYDLANDPEEQINLTDHRPLIVEDLKNRLRLRLAKQPREPKMICPNI
jgi:arylsulfatase A-like enzyme